MIKLIIKLVSIVLLFVTTILFGQRKEAAMFSANVNYETKNFVAAEENYRTATAEAKPKLGVANYNLGTTIYKQNKIAEAENSFKIAIKNATTKEEKHKSFHNLGNAFMQAKNYQGALEAYKNALRNNPQDDETRYNFALAKKMLEQNPPKKDDKDKDKKDQDKKDEDKKDQDKKDQDKKDNKKDNKKDKGNNEKENQKQKEPQGQNKQQIENLLKAMENAEKKEQEKRNAQKIKAQPVKTDKDW